MRPEKWGVFLPLLNLTIILFLIQAFFSGPPSPKPQGENALDNQPTNLELQGVLLNGSGQTLYLFPPDFVDFYGEANRVSLNLYYPSSLNYSARNYEYIQTHMEQTIALPPGGEYRFDLSISKDKFMNSPGEIEAIESHLSRIGDAAYVAESMAVFKLLGEMGNPDFRLDERFEFRMLVFTEDVKGSFNSYEEYRKNVDLYGVILKTIPQRDTLFFRY